MSAKFLLYVFVTFIVVWAFDSININAILKKNRIYQARVFYFLLAIAIIQLVTSFLYDLFEVAKFI